MAREIHAGHDTLTEASLEKVGMVLADVPQNRPAQTVGVYVQYGCGLCAPKKWLNFDASPRLRLEQVPAVRALLRKTAGLLFPPNVRNGDIVRGLPLPDGCASGVYCSHVLEHLPRNDLSAALRNTLRLLMPGGVFRLVVPDLGWRAARYLASMARSDPHAADILINSCLLGRWSKARNLTSLVRDHYGNSSHLWMYDFAALRALLEEVGFIGIRRCELGDASDAMFALVEDHGRFFENGERELAIEAVRPLAD